MFTVSLNYKNTPQDIRGSFTLDNRQIPGFLRTCKAAGISELVYLGTCNRMEIYGEGDHEIVIRLLAEEMKADPSLLRSHAYVLRDDQALQHLFRVTAGLDSMVIGEDEILGQIRRAYMLSKEEGCTGYLLNEVFQAAMRAAKRVKTETLLSKSSVSVATLAAAYCHKYMEGSKNVLLIGGSGEIGSKVLKNLLSYGDCRITATVRQHHISDEQVTVIPYADHYQAMQDTDIVISATTSPHYTVTRAMMEAHGVQHRPRLFVDLAVPADIDGCVAGMEGAELIRMDAFEAIAARHNAAKEQEAVTAADILSEEMDELQKSICFHRSYALFGRIRARRGTEFEKFFYEFKRAADAESFRRFLEVLEKMEEAAAQ